MQTSTGLSPQTVEAFVPLLPRMADANPPPMKTRPSPAEPAAGLTNPAEEIVISIGRIDIRAAEARTIQERPSASPAPRLMSLEDHLSQRRRR
jgi:hypothetical protein